MLVILRIEENKINTKFCFQLQCYINILTNFCSKVKIRDSFDKIIRDIDCNEFFISYSEDGLLNHKDLISFLSNYGNVESHEILYKRFKSRRDNPNQKGPDITEYLIHLSI